MKIGMVVINYNDYETTLNLIKQIQSFSSLNKIVIVDNCSTDNSYEILKKQENKKIKVIKTVNNNGYAYGNNLGIKYLENNCKVDYVIISNPDILIKEDGFNKLISKLDNKIDVIAPLIKQGNEIIRGWRLPTFTDELLSNINFIQRYAKKRTLYQNEEYKGSLTKVEVVSGCFFIIKSKTIKEVGYFDEKTFLYYEENILGKKLKNANKNSYIYNKVEVIHDLSVSINKSFKSLKKYKILKTSQRYYQKNYNNANVFGIFILYFTYVISLFISAIVIFFRKIGGQK